MRPRARGRNGRTGSRAGRLAATLAGVLLAAALTAASASALVISGWHYDQFPKGFFGAGCGSVSRQVMRLSPGTRTVRGVEPALGEALVDRFGRRVARVTSVRVSKPPHADGTITWTAVGAFAPCEEATSFPRGWTTEPITFMAHWFARESVPVYVNPLGYKFVRRPHRIQMSYDITFFLADVRWQRYGGRVALATAKAHMDDCEPSCANGTFHVTPMRLRLTHPIQCQGRWIYSRMHWRAPRPPLQGYGYRRRGVFKIRPNDC